MIKVKKVNNKKLNLLEKIYLWEIARGMFVTGGHFFRNLFRPSAIITRQYPEEPVPLEGAARFRTRHRLKLRKDGGPKCVACFMCQTACPAGCISITAEEDEKLFAEKHPSEFTIDLSKCVMCGFCVEACPEDAIIMDTEIIPGGTENREELLLSLSDLMLPGKEISERGAVNRRMKNLND